MILMAVTNVQDFNKRNETNETIKSIDLQFLLNCLKDGSWKRFKKDHRIRPYLSMIHELSEIDSIIYRGSDIIIIPEDLTHKVTSMLHELGHQGETTQCLLSNSIFTTLI